MPPVIFCGRVRCAWDNIFPPRRALRDTPPAHRTTHANYVCAGPGGGGGHSGVVPFWYIAFYYCDHPGTSCHPSAEGNFIPRRNVPVPLRWRGGRSPGWLESSRMCT